MKKICTLIIGVFCLISLPLEARTMQEASAIASTFIQMQGESIPAKRIQQAANATSISVPVKLAYTQLQIDNTTPAVYVFNSTDKGFVLVSAEDNARAVLGYSDEGHFDATNIPENMQFWLQMYADEMNKVKGERQEAKGKQAVARKNVATASYPTVAPILGSTVWGQTTPFNNMCPLYNGQRSVTGCVATAISQIMYAHKHPTKGTGSYSYTTTSLGLNVSADFNTTYDWANMIPNYNGNYTTTQANAVAKLLFHAGVAAEMDYTPEASGAVSLFALGNITKYFGYDKGINVLPKDFIPQENILQAIATELQAGRPVYMGGSTVNNEGHAFVCDGMKNDGYLHINWGWNGYSDGYFALSALDPENQGTGGSASNDAFTENVNIYTNIKPDAGGQSMPLITVDALTRTCADAISRSDIATFSLTRFASAGIATAKGKMTYFIYNSNGQLVTKVGIADFELEPSYYYTSPISVHKSLPSTLANGEYELEIRYIDSYGTDHPILVKGLGEVRIPFTATSTQFVFGETPEAEVEINPVSHADLTNQYFSNTWEIDLYSKKFWVNTPSESEVLIRFTINSTSSQSVIGTYILDPTNSGAAGTINADAIYAVGYCQSCRQYTPSDMHLTILPNEDGTLHIQYYVVANGEVFQHSFDTQEVRWIYRESGTNKLYYYTDYTYDLASTLPASKALQLTQSLSHTDLTPMSYFVEGTISNMRNTAEQIAQYKTARFDISDDGSTTNQFYCYNTKWLGNTNFTTGNEIKLGDEVVLLGQLQNYNGNTPEISGYIYEHHAGEAPVDYSIKNLQVTTNQDTLSFNFESEAPFFHVKITKDDGTTIVNDIIDFKEAYITLDDGTYTLWIRPVDEAQEYYIGDAVEATFTIQTTSVDYSIKNLQVTTNQDTVFFNFESEAPYFHIKVTKDDGTIAAKGIIDFKNVYIILDNGTYTLWIRPVDEAQEYYIGDAVEATFVIETTPTGIEDITTDEMLYLYDVLGRMVDSKPASDNRPFDVPQSGMYILNGKKVMITK